MRSPANSGRPSAFLFDKDGTLFDFQATWGAWAADLVLDLAGQDARRAAHLADLILLDLGTARFHPGSPVIAGTAKDAVAALKPGLPERSPADILGVMIERSRGVEPVEATPLRPLLEHLRRDGYRLGVATNDSEAGAQSQLRRRGVLDCFDFLAGADSGHGAKPGPGQCLAFAAATGLAPGQVAMVGDSTHDLEAGATAGMITIGVLTGPASRDDLAPLASVVLPDIGHLPAWIATL